MIEELINKREKLLHSKNKKIDKYLYYTLSKNYIYDENYYNYIKQFEESINKKIKHIEERIIKERESEER